MSKIAFSDCVEIVGDVVKSFDSNRKYISTGAIDIDHIDDSQTERITFLDRPSRANLIACKDDILFAKMQGTAKTFIVDEKSAEYVYSTGFCAVRANIKVITVRCLYHLLSSEYFLSQKDKYCSGATQKAITNGGLQKITFSIPSIEIQAHLSDTLDGIINVINICNTILEKLNLLVKSRSVGRLLLTSEEVAA